MPTPCPVRRLFNNRQLIFHFTSAFSLKNRFFIQINITVLSPYIHYVPDTTSSMVSESRGGAVPQQQLCDYQAASPDEVALVKWTDNVNTFIYFIIHILCKVWIHPFLFCIQWQLTLAFISTNNDNNLLFIKPTHPNLTFPGWNEPQVIDQPITKNAFRNFHFFFKSR